MSQTNADDPTEIPVRPFDFSRNDFPAGWRVDVAEPRPIEQLKEPETSIMAALANPLHSPPLSDLVKSGDQVCVTFTHPAVPCPEHLLVPALLRELEQAGVRDQDVTLLCASSLHGRTSYEEKVARLGADVVERYRVVDHDVGEVIHLGQWQGVPLTVNRCALEADLAISTGVVAPHLYAGYSGGIETVAIGCAGEATIEAIHAPRFIYHSQVRPGQVMGNPFQEILRAIAERAGLRFILNVILGPGGQIVDVQAGDPQLAHQYMVFSASNLFNSLVPQTYDVVVAGLDAPHDASLYQAVLGALFVGMAPMPAVRPGGAILLPAGTPNAIGETVNAQNFFNALQGAHTLEAVISDLLERGYRPGEARAFQLARLLEGHEVVVVGSEFPAMVRACHMQEAADLEQALDLVGWLLGDNLDVLIIPHSLHTLPVAPTPEPDEWLGLPMADRRFW